MSRISTSTVSPRLASVTACSAGVVSISRSAASHRALYPVVMVCGIVLSPRPTCWRVEGRDASRHHLLRGVACGPMTVLGLPDLAALAWFLGAWIAYSLAIEKSA